MPGVVRTPDDRFSALPDFPWEPRYFDWDGIRLARIDEGEGPPVIFFHGEPTWSFVWRHVIPPVLDAGFRCIAPDLPGFGRSDKPTDPEWYSYDRHAAAAGALLEHLDVRDATVVVHDWGGPIGLRAATEHPERVSRLVIMNTALFNGQQRMSDAWKAFREVVAATDDLPIGALVDERAARDLDAAEIAAYDAPFHTAASKAGARAFPLMIPLESYDPGAGAGERVLLELSLDERPTLMLWAGEDELLPPEAGRRFAHAIKSAEPEVIEGAGHLLQEDAGSRRGWANCRMAAGRLSGPRTYFVVSSSSGCAASSSSAVVECEARSS